MTARDRLVEQACLLDQVRTILTPAAPLVGPQPLPWTLTTNDPKGAK